MLVWRSPAGAAGGEDMSRRAEQAGFTLLEVLIAMSILAVGATSVLSIFVWAISFHTKRVDENRLTQLYNHALTHAGIAWNAFDPDSVEEGQSPVPKEIVADLSDPYGARTSKDPMIVEAAEKFPGYKYVIRFEENDLAVKGSSVVASIEIHGLGGSTLTTKQFLTRNGAPITERFKYPSIDKRDAKGKKPRSQ
jgi:prepilin-type N-terminal cleavage/methylation domain-containing protein